MRKTLAKLPLGTRQRKEASVLFRRVSIETMPTDEVARVRLGSDIEVALTTAAEPGWVAALLNALEARR